MVRTNGVVKAAAEAAIKLGITRQAVSLIVHKYPHLVLKVGKEVEYRMCKVCELDMPVTMLFKSVCSHCREQLLRRCSTCGVSFRANTEHYFFKKGINNICVSCKSAYDMKCQNKLKGGVIMIYDRIKQDIKDSMRARLTGNVQALRMLDSEIQNKMIAVKTTTPDDALVVSVLQRGIKQRQESAEAFAKGNRPELAQNEMDEIGIWKQYLPAMMDEQEIKSIIRQQASTITGRSGALTMGSLMSALSPVVKGKAEGKLVSTLVKEFLAGNWQ